MVAGARSGGPAYARQAGTAGGASAGRQGLAVQDIDAVSTFDNSRSDVPSEHEDPDAGRQPAREPCRCRRGRDLPRASCHRGAQVRVRVLSGSCSATVAGVDPADIGAARHQNFRSLGGGGGEEEDRYASQRPAYGHDDPGDRHDGV